MKISARTKQIIQCLLGSGDAFVTVQWIGDRMGISARTVLRELPTAEKWLSQNGFLLEVKKGSGVQLVLTLEQKERLRSLLQLEKVDKEYTPEQRKTIILGELMLKQKITKLYYFASLLGVTEGTLSHDLNEVESWLARFDIRLERKPGLGIYITGEEKDIRRAGISLFYDNIDQARLHKMFLQKLQEDLAVEYDEDSMDVQIQERLLHLIDVELIPLLEEVVRQMEARIGYKLADDAFTALVVHLAIAIQRIRGDEQITMDPAILEQLKQSREYAIARELVEPIAETVGIRMPEEEAGYIAMHLQGGRSRATQSDIAGISMTQDFRLIRIGKEIMRIAEEETGQYLEENERLLVGLVRHLGPAITRIRHNMEIRNPLQKDIETLYPKLTRIAQKCARAIEVQEKIQIPPAEVAYIAMHIGAALEQNRRKNLTKFRVAVACASGIAVSRMLSTRIEKEFGNIDVVDVISTVNIDRDSLHEKGVDLIVSTLPIPGMDIPVLVVGPFLDEEEQKKLQDFIRCGLPSSMDAPAYREQDAYSTLRRLGLYHKKIMGLLEGFRLMEGVDGGDMESVIALAAETFAAEGEGGDKVARLREDLLQREAQGSTILESKGIMILHCRSEGVDRIRFAVLRLGREREVANTKGKTVPVRTMAVLLAPRDEPKPGLEILSEITRGIVEEEEFSTGMREGMQETLENHLSRLLLGFYRQKMEMK
ncbi:BglG family transcription antiterminator [Anaerotalea alkaliphila]|uniref:Transcription antiterminator n=1 Tax=Anaerotalea alkaliphila TaxID=2662126 RepID=A0A7X5KLM4_9FIRM|nr:BglG family transcription antiterminator [Anaerotalea alkaliphila]NDL66991.1 transcription antiterminator [Anaerotalea alkaliphila]